MPKHVHMYCMYVSMCVSEIERARETLPISSGFVLHFENGFTRLWLLPILGLFS